MPPLAQSAKIHQSRSTLYSIRYSQSCWPRSRARHASQFEKSNPGSRWNCSAAALRTILLERQGSDYRLAGIASSRRQCGVGVFAGSRWDCPNGLRRQFRMPSAPFAAGPFSAGPAMIPSRSWLLRSASHRRADVRLRWRPVDGWRVRYRRYVAGDGAMAGRHERPHRSHLCGPRRIAAARQASRGWLGGDAFRRRYPMPCVRWCWPCRVRAALAGGQRAVHRSPLRSVAS